MRLTYVSEGGRIEMAGGSHPLMNISKKSGFELPVADYETIRYAGENGQTTIGKTDLARTITLTGDLYGGQLEIMRFLNAIYYPGELYCDFGQVKRKIACKCTNQDDIERHLNSGINGFTVQFQADCPYFNDFYDTEVSLAAYKNHVSDSFTLPCVFTEIINEGRACNRGDKIVYPVITLTVNCDSSLDTTELTVTNNTIGKSIVISHSPVANERIIMDFNTRRIISKIGNESANITKKIISGMDMEKFYLEKGENNLTFSTTDTQQPITAIMSFNNIYIMAVN